MPALSLSGTPSNPYKTYTESSTEVLNLQVTNDIIQVLSSGYLRNIKVIDHTEKGRTICDKISAGLDPEEFTNALKREILTRTSALEEKGVDENGKLKILRVFNDVCSSKRPCIKIVVKALKNIPLRYSQYVYIDYFDKNGNPLDGQKRPMNFLDAGEIRLITIESPPSHIYRVWLKK